MAPRRTSPSGATVVPNPTWSNIAREVLMDAAVAPTIPAFSTVMACSTSMIGAIEAAGMINGVNRNLALVGGVESLSRIQLGLGQSLSDWIRKFQQARSLGQKVSHVTDLKLGDVNDIPAVSNRTTGMSMGEHTEITAKEWNIGVKSRIESRWRVISARSPPGTGVSSTISSSRSATYAATPSRVTTRRSRSWRSCRRVSTGPAAGARSPPETHRP